MAASVNNIASTFSSSRKTLISSPAFSSSPNSHFSASFPPISSSSSISISVSWNPHKTLTRSSRSSILSFYGPPGPIRPPLKIPRCTISVGKTLPCSTLSYFSNGIIRTITSSDLARGRKILILGVRAAFVSRQLSRNKLNAEELIRREDDLKRRGVELVACVSVNDVFVMRAWGEKIGAFSSVMMISDPDAGMAKAMGLAEDFTGGDEGFGLRSENYCVVAVNGIVKSLFREEDGVGFDDLIRAI